MSGQKNPHESRSWRVWVALVNSTLIVFGLWWLNVNKPVFPKPVEMVVLTIAWLGNFVREAFRD